ncbi:MAG: hypothetical protein HYX87_07400, partial [Chloroflexi bacterium]|nr:hypothetical protein [Chloroflexota bacterium]
LRRLGYIWSSTLWLISPMCGIFSTYCNCGTSVSGRLAVGSYTGNNTDNRSISGVGFQPEWVVIQRTSTDQARHKLASTGATSDYSQLFDVVADETNRIQALESDGFQLGNGVGVNVSSTYYYIAFNQIALESYEDSGRTTVRNTYTSSFNTVYMHGTGFANTDYLVAYYDNGGVKRGSETPSASGGTLNSTYLLTSDLTAAAGTWHALVQPSSGYTGFGTASYATIVASPDTYGLLANDSFTVESSAIPEFPTVVAGIAVAGMCAVIYWWLRNRRLAHVQA